MTVARRLPVSFLVTCAVLVTGVPLVRSGPAPSSKQVEEQAARKYVEAFRANDEAAMRSISEGLVSDAHVFADIFLDWHEETTAAGTGKTDFLAVAESFAQRIRSRPEVRGLPVVVAAWRLWTRDDLARDARLRELAVRAKDAERRGASDEIVALLEEARPDLERARASVSVLSLRGVEFLSHKRAGRLAEASAACHASLAVSDEMRWPASKGHALGNLGLVESARSRHGAAAAAFEESLAIREAFGPPSTATWLRVLLCRQWRLDGRLAEALAVGERALADHEALGPAGRPARVLGYLGDVRSDLGQDAVACGLYDRAVVAYEAAGERLNAATQLEHAAVMRLHPGALDLAGAEERFARVIATAEALGDAPLVAHATLGLGRATRGRGATREAVTILRRSVDLAARSGSTETEMLSFASLGVAHLHLSEPGPAIEALEHAIRIGKERGLPSWHYPMTYWYLARAYRLADRPRDAARTAQAGLTIWRGRARDLGEDFGAHEQRRGGTVADTGVLAALRWASVEPQAREEATAAAFALSEAARGALLAESLDEATAAPVASAESAEEAQARRRFEEARQKLLLLAFGDSSDDIALAAARDAYEAASDARREARALGELRRRGPTRPPVEPLSLAQARAAVPADALLVLYHVTVERVVAVAVGRDGADLIDLGDSRSIVGAALAWRAALATPDGDEGTLPEALYDALVAPLESRLQHRTTLLVGRDLGLSFLPFEAMVRARGERRQRAVELWSFAYVPSATVYATLARRSAAGPTGDTLITLGDPVYPGEGGRSRPDADRAHVRGLASLDRLAASADEVREVAAHFTEARRIVLLRDHATRDRLASALETASGRLRLLHFACHGFADSRLPGRSGLVLSEADVLTVDDVSRMRVPANLVVLSACESGRGLTRSGEGVLGLPRAFLAAGANRVVAADRAVADHDARELLRRFYDAHLRDGLEPAAALRAAKVARIREGGPAAHPYAWASVVLWE